MLELASSPPTIPPTLQSVALAVVCGGAILLAIWRGIRERGVPLERCPSLKWFAVFWILIATIAFFGDQWQNGRQRKWATAEGMSLVGTDGTNERWQSSDGSTRFSFQPSRFKPIESLIIVVGGSLYSIAVWTSSRGLSSYILKRRAGHAASQRGNRDSDNAKGE